MKKCPFCAEEIQSEAIKCKHCGEWLADDTDQEKRDEDLKESQSSEAIIDTNNFPTSNDQIIEISPKKPSLISNILYFLLWLAVLSGIFFNIMSPREIFGQEAFYMSFWIGILSAWTAKRKGKSGWLWFIIGFILIGFSIVSLSIISQPFLRIHNSFIEKKLKDIKPAIMTASFQKLKAEIRELDQIEDVSTIPNIKNAIKLIESSQHEIANIEKAYQQINDFVNKYEKELKMEDLEVLAEIMFINKKIRTVSHLRKYNDYLNAYKKWLEFSRDNFDEISAEIQAHMKEYDALYSNYESAFNELYEAEIKKEKALNEYLETHPEFIGNMQKLEKRLNIKLLVKFGR